MNALYFSAGSAIYEVNADGPNWMMEEKPSPHQFLCLAADPASPGRLYGGTFDNGLWISDDSGETWERAGTGITYNRVMSVAVSPTEVRNGYRVVWAGTEPSGLFRSEDGGRTWIDCPALLDLPSKSTWSFPPRPHTHHVRWIEPDPHDENRIFVGIELGGVMKSEDKGRTWEDRKPGSQHDCHMLTIHPHVSGRVYEAAGGGYAESADAGATWQTVNEGLEPYNYLVGIAVDPADENTMVASAAQSPRTAYRPEGANTILVRREKQGPWTPVHEGLPEAYGSTVFALATDPSAPGVFYAVNNQGVYLSDDGGKTWEQMSLKWPEHLTGKRIRGLAAVGTGSNG
ncbi:WD40/YVTN/BNR-like repeat-containing protein [Salinicoccus albus]|uniref:WD40/YVTN/BNR-like repeat-containing protein n=1 Tax=Salinicoccus albus TaxID=418756 RepID=UPI0003621735|nr:hypothetical protein [Salinicoccus albus]